MSKIINLLAVSTILVSCFSHADDLAFKSIPDQADYSQQESSDGIDTSLLKPQSSHVYKSGDMFNGRETFFYRIKSGDDYEVRGLPVAKSNFIAAADNKIDIWTHVANCDMGSYVFTSPATNNVCTFNVSATCSVDIRCFTGDNWACNFESDTPNQLVELLRQDKANNLGMEAITPYEYALYSSTYCKLKN